MTDRTAIVIERVLVAVRPMDQPDNVVDIATRLAAMFGAELSGHFVKDRDLINFAALSFTRRVDMKTGALEALDIDMMERALAVHADAAKKALAARAAALQLQWSFETITAPVVEAVTRLSREPGLVIATLDGDGQPRMLERQLAELVDSVPTASPVLLLRTGQPIHGPVVATPDERALAYADYLAREFGQPLVVLAQSEAEQARVVEQAGGLTTPVRIEPVGARGTKPPSPFACGLLVIGRHDIADYAGLAEQTGCHIFITDEA
jgi:alkylhydroperoxidase/carboxymuconolactone decarboxylase family protein YurZ